jgi:hypothetical protein
MWQGNVGDRGVERLHKRRQRHRHGDYLGIDLWFAWHRSLDPGEQARYAPKRHFNENTGECLLPPRPPDAHRSGRVTAGRQ